MLLTRSVVNVPEYWPNLSDLFWYSSDLLVLCCLIFFGKMLILHLTPSLITLWFELILHWSWPLYLPLILIWFRIGLWLFLSLPLILFGCCCCSNSLSRVVVWSGCLRLLYVHSCLLNCYVILTLIVFFRLCCSCACSVALCDYN
jgi:hypothetical protein